MGFSESFARSEKTLVLPVYSAGESQDNYKTSMDLVNKMNETDTVAKYCETFDDVIDQLSVTLSQSDIIVIMGAGNVTNISKKLFQLSKVLLNYESIWFVDFIRN